MEVSGLRIANVQLALAATSGNYGVDEFDIGLQG